MISCRYHYNHYTIVANSSPVILNNSKLVMIAPRPLLRRSYCSYSARNNVGRASALLGRAVKGNATLWKRYWYGHVPLPEEDEKGAVRH